MGALKTIKPSLRRRVQQIYATCSPPHDLGDVYVRDGVLYTKRSNGYAYRYVPNSLPVTIVNSSVSDSTSGYQTMFTVRIPAGTFHQGDTINFAYRLTGAASNYDHRMSFTHTPTYANIVSDYIMTNVPLGNMSITLEAQGDTIFRVVTSNFIYAQGQTTQLINTLNDIVVTFATRFNSTASGRTQNVQDVVVTYTPASTSVPADMSLYRMPDLQPFRNDSPWNIPLDPATTTFENTAPLGPLTKVVRDPYAGKAVKSGQVSVVHWAQCTSQSCLPVYQIQEYDTEQTWNITTAGGSPGVRPCMPSMLNMARSSTSSFRMKSPKGPITTGQSGDACFVMITPDKRYAIEVGSYSYNATTRVHTGVVYFIDLYNYGFNPKYCAYSGLTMFTNTQVNTLLLSSQSGFRNSFRAPAFPLIGGLVRKWELEAGVIDHMIQMQMAETQGLSTVMTCVSASGNTFVVKARNPNVTEADYTSLFSIPNINVRHGGVNYLLTGTTSYNAATAETTFTVQSTITSTGSQLIYGSDNTNGYDRQYQWPGADRDAAANNTVGGYDLLIKLGQVFAIPPSVDVTTLGLTAEGLALARAIQKYGAMVSDIAGNTLGICQTEAGLTGTQQSNLITDAPKIVAQLVAVTNYNATTVRAAYDNAGLTKPKPILPLYNTGVS